MTTCILAVDDEPDLEALLRQKFRRQIREGVFDLVFACDGVDALAKLEEHPVDIVLTDINMPKMDGLALLTRLKERNPLIKSIIVSAYGDMDNIRVAMNRGAYDFITKPIDFQDLEATLNKTIADVDQRKLTLQAIKENNILKMYVDENVLNFLTRSPFEHDIMLSETVDAAVMFVDLCEFTKISERWQADRVVNLLNSFFDLVVKEVSENDGHVNKFIGDAVMSVFRGEFHADRALEASLAIRSNVGRIGEAAAHDRNFVPRVSIGIDAGQVVSGNIGARSLARLDFTVVGDIVNTAARYQFAAAENQIVIGKRIYEKIRQSFECEEIGEVFLKNKTDKDCIYNVLA